MNTFSVLALAAALQACTAAVVSPPWSTPFHNAQEMCVDASDSQHPNNKRLVFYATPEGTPPPTGWPVYFSFVTDKFPSANGTQCGEPSRKPYPAWVMPGESLNFCPCIKTNTCHPYFKDKSIKRDKSLDVKQPPHHEGCDYDDLAGILWDQRIKQVLLANGFAVVQVNPIEDDSWDAWDTAPQKQWTNGNDKPFLLKVFDMLAKGAFGKLDAKNVAIRGWSGGAQMVSWMFNVVAEGSYMPAVTFNAGIFLAGGSHDCYESLPITSHGICKTCNPLPSCPGSQWHSNAGCSSNLTHPPCCQKCCPTNYTEQYYFDHPQDYSKHPPSFLAQLTTQDENADLCACKNYYETLQQYGVYSELSLVSPKYEKCYCLGDPTDPAATGSPYSQYCTKDMSWSCETHTMGFAEMIVPAVQFLKNVISNKTATAAQHVTL